ncbi:sigma-54 interaction domain-containing protein [Bacillus sp. NSP9.1]|uniref:sigma-54 interaction domain-containing protein n=1 Tax=Bacillus sp. NSP9.1 TaxID=1071078 RepID=UPI00041F7FDB|nr:sigma 54-interacting transcriptional regulator [Bacillus sp. NSP9.1]QHZ47127.1 AAA family ATPase [Bacillus sp. NSP9.1]
MTYYSELVEQAKKYELNIRNELGVDAILTTVEQTLGFETVLHDAGGMVIGGTGRYGMSFGRGRNNSVVAKVLETGRPYIVRDSKTSDLGCSNCRFNDKCGGYGAIAFPVYGHDRTLLGVISIVGFSEEHKKKIAADEEFYFSYLAEASLRLKRRLKLTRMPKQKERRSPHDVLFEDIIGNATGMKNLIAKTRKVVNSPSTVLIQGESGTGKELIARAIHCEGNRSRHPFIALNCSAIPDTLLESELFGYEGGAFTGSKKSGQKGKFELAHQGTIFLDEIGDMPLSLQPKILRVLQERYIEPIGSTKSVPIQVRVIAATHRNLEEMVRNGEFREDLYYRLNVIPLHTMPLRERRADIPLFCDHFIRKHSLVLNKRPLELEPDLEEWLIRYDWPGNIRQLENAIEYMVNMAETDVISFSDLPEYLQEQVEPVNSMSLEQLLAQYERKILESYLIREEYRKDKGKVAKELRISLSTLYRKLEKYEFCIEDWLGGRALNDK